MLVYHHRRWSQERLMESYKHHLVKFQPFGRCVNHRSKGHREDDREFKGVRAGGRGVGTLALRQRAWVNAKLHDLLSLGMAKALGPNIRTIRASYPLGTMLMIRIKVNRIGNEDC